MVGKFPIQRSINPQVLYLKIKIPDLIQLPQKGTEKKFQPFSKCKGIFTEGGKLAEYKQLPGSRTMEKNTDGEPFQGKKERLNQPLHSRR